MKHRLDHRHPAMQLLHRAILRELRWQWVALLSLLGFGGALLFVFFQRNVILTALGLVCLLGGVRFAMQLARRPRVESTRLFRLLTHEPLKIVWVYAVVTQRMPFGLEFARNGLLYFKLIDGDEISVSLPADKLRLVSHYLSRCLPHATFGYSQDRAQWFAASPERLLRNDPGEEAENEK